MQTPPEQSLEQHTDDDEQREPEIWQVLSSHTPPTQVDPSLQHWLEVVQLPPAMTHVEEVHWPLEHVIEQHCVFDEHDMPAPEQEPTGPHAPALHCDEQHCVADVQAEPSSRQALPCWHLPELHVMEQHCESLVHASPFAVQPDGPQVPPTQVALQHWALVVHASPLSVHADPELELVEVPAPVELAAEEVDDDALEDPLDAPDEELEVEPLPVLPIEADEELDVEAPPVPGPLDEELALDAFEDDPPLEELEEPDVLDALELPPVVSSGWFATPLPHALPSSSAVAAESGIRKGASVRREARFAMKIGGG